MTFLSIRNQITNNGYSIKSNHVKCVIIITQNWEEKIEVNYYNTVRENNQTVNLLLLHSISNAK